MPTGPYLDTSILLKLYVSEPNSQAADALVQKFATPLPLTPLQALELRTALTLKEARGELQPGAADDAISDFQSDLHAKRYWWTVPDFEAVFRRAEALSREHAASTKCRTLDILHVATALELGSAQFASFDSRQKALAAKCGLFVSPS